MPKDNPFVGTARALPEIWSLGHRNPQGLAVRADGNLWEHEHGPFGGDEINISAAARTTAGPRSPSAGSTRAGRWARDSAARSGMEQPVHYFIPSIAPSGMKFYTGNAFPVWRGNLFIGAMGLTHLGRYVFRGDTLVREERMFDGMPWRVRAVAQGPEGYLYLGVDTGHAAAAPPG